VRYALELSGADGWIVTNLDVLSGFDEIRPPSLQVGGRETRDWPAADSTSTRRARVPRTPAGTRTSRVRALRGPALGARAYVEWLETRGRRPDRHALRRDPSAIRSSAAGLVRWPDASRPTRSTRLGGPSPRTSRHHGRQRPLGAERGLRAIFGTRKASDSVREITTECARMGVESLTLYAFSVENWKRPVAEVRYLMRLLRSSS
jgi:hypothetical protein